MAALVSLGPRFRLAVLQIHGAHYRIAAAAADSAFQFAELLESMQSANIGRFMPRLAEFLARCKVFRTNDPA